MLSRLQRRFLASALKTLGSTQVHRLLSEKKAGVIFMLHRVTDDTEGTVAFKPNRHLSVGQSFLTEIIALVRKAGMDVISIDEAAERLQRGNPGKFAVFTFDDGYKDNLHYALPVFEAATAPFAVFVPSAWPEDGGFVWWEVLERIVAAADGLELGMNGTRRLASTHSVPEKYRVFDALRASLMRCSESQRRDAVNKLANQQGLDAIEISRAAILNMDELRSLASRQLVTIGSHSRTHALMAALEAKQMHDEMSRSKSEIEAITGRPCQHFAYPYGSVATAGEREFDAAADVGYRTALTTRRGLVHAGERVTALPRIPLDGDMQDAAIIEFQLSGLPFSWRERGAR